jgi:5-methylcytosine-specific restriction enzyme subunit McrC
MSAIKIKNIYHMLSYVFQSLRETGMERIAAESFDNVHNLFAAIIARGGAAQLKRGLPRDYSRHEEALAGLRGQILVGETIRRQTFPARRMVCAFDELSIDSPQNQAVKSVILLLARHGNVSAKNREDLLMLAQRLHDVKELDPRVIRWGYLRNRQIDASFQMLLGVCELDAKGLLLTTEQGGLKLASWLQDEAKHRLFEKFVRAYYERHHQEFSPRSANIHSVNLQQIYSYVKNYDKEGGGKVAGLVLYAKAGDYDAPNVSQLFKGNMISFKTLDLDQEWSGIVKQLESYCEWLTEP